MNSLDTLKERLKHKPSVQHNIGVKVILGQPIQGLNTTDNTTRQLITAERDDGVRAQYILEQITKNKLSAVVKQFTEEVKEPLLTKAPQLIAEPIKKPKRIKKDFVVLEEDKEGENAVIPEGGPQLEEQPIDNQDHYVEAEQVLDPQINNEKPKRQFKGVAKGVIPLGSELMVQIGDTSLAKRLPPLPVFNVRVSSYYMNNREIFVNFINNLFNTYKEELLDDSKGITCEDIGKDTGDISLLTHQKIVRDYINLYTPYRGLLLYHGLGSGKTCSSIAIAEGMKSARKVIIMTPASLRRNYIEEIKKCGDLIYRKNQYWEWISITDNQSLVDPLSASLGLPREFIGRKQGAWLVNITKSSNYSELSTSDKKILNDQLDEMIKNKYTFINYNGLRRNKFRQLTDNFETNIFDNSVVIIDEAHNLISRIVNKINKISKFNQIKRGPNAMLPLSISLLLYEFLLKANNCRVVLLTGTPIINYPNEIGILFNILRGYIKTWSFPLSIETSKKLSKETFQIIFAKEKFLDYIDYVPSSKTLTITRNPYGFENKITASSGYKGVTNEMKEKRNEQGVVEKDSKGNIAYEERGSITDTDFIKRIVKILKKNDITTHEKGTTFNLNTALPDTLDEFVNMFINKDTGNIVNTDKFKRRIIGLTSYFRSAQEELLPSYDRDFDRHVIYIPMSNYQFKIYEDYRHEERLTEKPSKKSSGVIDGDGIFKEPSSTYRIFSRLACNFVMPTPPGRPSPSQYSKLVGDAKKEDNLGMEHETKGDETKGELDVIGIKNIPHVEGATEQYTLAKHVNDKENAEDNIVKVVKNREKVDAKAEAKLVKDREKEEAKAVKDREKEEAKLVKDREKVEATLVKDREREEAKERKKLERAKHGGGSESDESGSEKDFVTTQISKLIGEHDDDDDDPIQMEHEDAILRDADELEGDELLEKMGSIEYKEAIKSSLRYLQIHSQQFLSKEGLETYSPKFLAMLQNIEFPEHQGLHLVYSQFRTMEGIGIFTLTLEANGFAKFKIKRTGINGWELNMSEEDMGKPCYALYTGTEDAEEREILRNIYNGMWDYIPNNIAIQLRAKSSNNNLGEIIKVLMITSAGSEGINLRNTRYVHIMEPYWHPVRIEQVIGRARRICSHQELSKELQTVEVYIYIMTITQEQLDSEFALELKLKDISKQPPYLPQTSDQKLLEISTIKEQLSSQLLKAVKESSIDCATHSNSTSKEGLVCLSFGQPTVNEFSYNPNISQDENDTVANINKIVIDWEARPFTHKPTGKRYMIRMDTKQLYDYDSVIRAKQVPGVAPILLGKLIKNSRGNLEIVKEI